MKRTNMMLVLLGCLSLAQVTQAQKQDRQAASQQEGYWVVTTSVQSPKQNVIRFYTEDHQCIREEAVSGRRVQVQRRSVVRDLQQQLRTHLLAYRQKNAGQKQGELARKDQPE